MLLITSLIFGLGAGPFNVGSGVYLSKCACAENKIFYNSFYHLFISSIITGMVVASVLVNSLK